MTVKDGIKSLETRIEKLELYNTLLAELLMYELDVDVEYELDRMINMYNTNKRKIMI